MSKLALAIIAKDEVAHLKRIITNYAQYFDEVAIAYDDDIVAREIQETEKVKLYKYEWCNDFAHKRNFLASKIQSEYYFRLDTDDEIYNAHLIPEAFKQYIKDGYTEVFMMYKYGFDENGVCNSRHWRETIIKNDGNLYWNKKIHENILPVVPRKLVAGKETQIWLVHICSKEEYQQSAQRNIKLLLEEYEATKDKPDPRTVGYIARMYLATKQWKAAIPFFEQFLATSGWDDDKYFAWIQLGECYTLSGKPETALNCCVEAVLMNPYYPDAYFHFMAVYYELKEYGKAIEWGRLGFAKKSPDHMLNQDDAAYTWRPTAQLGICYIHTGKLKEGVKLLEAAHKIAPKDEAISEALRYFTLLDLDDDMVKNYIALMNYTKGDLRKFHALVESIPRPIATDERLLVLRSMVEPGKIWDDKSVVFFCGGAWEDWVDSSIIGGIGGSEEATIYLSRELTKLGYKVTVYNQCGELAGEYKGVTYKNHYEFNPKDKFNIVISWRHNIFEKGIKAKKRIIWLHDVPGKHQFLKEDSDTYDKVIVLSEYHKSLLQGVPEDKIYVSRNGLNMADFDLIVEDRNPKRMIWASSYDRGLQPFLQYVYPQVKAEVPDAELQIFYGWNTYNAMIERGQRSQDWKNKMVALMAQSGVRENGRVGHKKLAREYFKSGIWAYPTTFEEISCIGAMRAQVCGAVPVVNNYAALSETVKWGIKNEGDIRKKETFDNYAKELISLLKDPQRQETIRQEMMPKAREIFSWSGVAESWKNDLFS